MSESKEEKKERMRRFAERARQQLAAPEPQQLQANIRTDLSQIMQADCLVIIVGSYQSPDGLEAENQSEPNFTYQLADTGINTVVMNLDGHFEKGSDRKSENLLILKYKATLAPEVREKDGKNAAWAESVQEDFHYIKALCNDLLGDRDKKIVLINRIHHEPKELMALHEQMDDPSRVVLIGSYFSNYPAVIYRDNVDECLTNESIASVYAPPGAADVLDLVSAEERTRLVNQEAERLHQTEAIPSTWDIFPTVSDIQANDVLACFPTAGLTP
ncbi:MAG: hypothetical protein K0U37_03895 [Gammaproteobacteria bacterium]|nr:hypothetical protein [Gammaproteobacteria bacterium]